MKKNEVYQTTGGNVLIIRDIEDDTVYYSVISNIPLEASLKASEEIIKQYKLVGVLDEKSKIHTN